MSEILDREAIPDEKDFEDFVPTIGESDCRTMH